jgi:hypothetical protein
MPVDETLIALAVKADATLHQQFSYPTDTSGAPWGVFARFHQIFFCGT